MDALPHWGTYRRHVLARYNAPMLWTRRSSHKNYTDFLKGPRVLCGTVFGRTQYLDCEAEDRVFTA